MGFLEQIFKFQFWIILKSLIGTIVAGIKAKMPLKEAAHTKQTGMAQRTKLTLYQPECDTLKSKK